MTTGFCALADQLAQRFAAISETIEVQILNQMLSGGDTFCSYQFEIDELTLRGLTALFQRDARLWEDFRKAVCAHRPATHWTTLLDQVYAVGNLEGKLRLLEQGISCPSAEDGLRMADYLNALDGELGECQDMSDRRNLAGREPGRRLSARRRPDHARPHLRARRPSRSVGQLSSRG